MLSPGDLSPHSTDKTVLIVIFKVSCPTCQFTLPFLERLYQGGLPVIAYSQDNEKATRELTDELRLTFPLRFDRPVYTISNAFAIDHVPSMFLVEPDGVISWALKGFHKAELEKLARRVALPLFRETERLPAMRPG